MSDSDDPFRGGDRTVFRPRPTPHRLQESKSPGPPDGAQGDQEQVSNHPPPDTSHNQQPVETGVPEDDQWAHEPVQRPPEAKNPERTSEPGKDFSPEHDPQHRRVARPVEIDSLNVPNSNPIAKQAAPLLILLGNLRITGPQGKLGPLMDHVRKSIEQFESSLRAIGVSAEQVTTAKYALCATADDIVQNTPSDERHVWAQHNMLSHFFGERQSGVRFFDELNRAKANPALNYDLLVLMHSCLSIGFEGIHRTAQGGAAALQQIRRDLYETLRMMRPRVNDEISPNWTGQAVGLRQTRHLIPIWAIAAFLGVLLFAFFLVLRFALAGNTGYAETQALSLLRSGEVTIDRSGFSRPRPQQQLQSRVQTEYQLPRIRRALASEIDSGAITIEPTANVITIRVGNLLLFQAGNANVIPEFDSVATRLAAMLDNENGYINIVGHTDNIPLKNKIRFESNFHLSEERAKAVAQVISGKITDPSRVRVEGKGAHEPVATNKTREGRAQNRRVEIVIPRDNTARVVNGEQ